MGQQAKTKLPNVSSAGFLTSTKTHGGKETYKKIIKYPPKTEKDRKEKEEKEDKNEEEEEEDYDNVCILGNKIVVRSLSSQARGPSFKSLSSHPHALPSPNTPFGDRCCGERDLKGDWLSYWQHEIGLSAKQQDFDVKQIKLQTFRGHTAAVKDLATFDNESSFITASKDKTLKLWCLRNHGNGDFHSTCEGTYRGHRRGLTCFSLLQNWRYVVSSDLTIQLWDPWRLSLIRRWDGCPPTTHLSSLPPHHFIAASPSDTLIRFVDVRSCRLSHHFKSTIVSTGQVKSIAVGDDGCYMAVAFTSGFVSCLDVRTGAYLGSWKAHEAEIHEMKVIGERLVTCAMDGGMSLWSFPAGKLLGHFRGLSENQRWLQHHNNTILTATPSQRINCHSLTHPSTARNQVKLKSDLIKGNLTCFSALPLNHLLLLAADNGDVTLIT